MHPSYPEHEALELDLDAAHRRVTLESSAEVILRSWAEFELELKKLRTGRTTSDRMPVSLFSKLLFRGHSDSSWKLQTTLERYTSKITTWSNYFELVRSLTPALKKNWELPSDISEWCVLRRGSSINPFAPPPAFPFLIYLRHHGFPSPLLDWSASAWVAAYFAFAAPGNQPRAIYAYLEDTGYGKRIQLSQPAIHVFGPWQSRLGRHKRQKAEYTACVKFIDRVRTIANHEDVFSRGNPRQDKLWKFVLPASERVNVLKHLDSYQLNGHTLFNTDDRLLETLALREIDFRP